ncbi:MAG: DUF4870 domain-containing protein [Syntrophobacterales bacterium]|nr:DUF4870 domain-containing protein [Syntrophobacterales bacterium]
MKASHNSQKNDDFRDDKATWASLCHFAALMGVVWWVPLGGMWVPVGQIVGPLGVWLIKRKVDPFVDLSGREALNFQINITAVSLGLAFFFDNIISLIVVWGIVLFSLFLVVRAGVVSSRGEIYKYPVPLVSIFPTKSLEGQITEKRRGSY